MNTQTLKGFCASTGPCVFIAIESPLDAVPVESTGK
jgi:hypothetical protein